MKKELDLILEHKKDEGLKVEPRPKKEKKEVIPIWEDLRLIKD